jgi:hypothetical protein
MKKIILAIILSISATLAFAGPSVEVGLGYASAQPYPTGTWYQEGLPYTLNTKSKTWMIGVTDDINQNLRWHVDYVNLGHYSSDAIATTDPDYNPSLSPPCNASPCVAQTRFIGSGTTNGVKATLEYHTKGDIEWGFSAGVFAFKPIWNETLYNWTDSSTRPVVPGPLYHSVSNPITFRPTLGVSAKKGNFETRLDFYNTQSYGAENATLMRINYTLTLVYHF